MQKYICLMLFVFIGSSAVAQSENAVEFSARELDAAFLLMRPELNTIEISGRSGTLNPSPSFKYLGVEQTKFDINLKYIADIFDLKFNNLKSKPFQVQFQDQGLVLSMPIQDQAKAIQSSVGSISFKGVTLVGVFNSVTRPNGSQAVKLKEVQVSGSITGTGILKGKLILKKTRELLVSVLTAQLNKLLEKQNVQDSVQNGLLTWSKFYTGNDYRSLVPGSIRFDQVGIHYDAQY